MLWLTPEGDYLIEGESCGLPSGAEIVGDPSGAPVRPAKFYLVDEGGGVKRTITKPIVYSAEDEFGVTNVHAVLGDTLQSYHWRIPGWGQEPEVSSEVLITGLRPVNPAEMPFDVGRVLDVQEETERQEQQQRAEIYRATMQEEEQELLRFREGLQKLSSPVDATWEYEPDGWVVKRADGLVLGRGKVRGYGIYVYRKLWEIMRDVLGSGCSLEKKITLSQELGFYSD